MGAPEHDDEQPYRWFSDADYQVEIARLEEKLAAEVRRRIEATNQRAEYASAASGARLERDGALKQVRDQEEGVANLLTQVQRQGIVIERLRDRCESLLPTADDVFGILGIDQEEAAARHRVWLQRALHDFPDTESGSPRA